MRSDSPTARVLECAILPGVVMPPTSINSISQQYWMRPLAFTFPYFIVFAGVFFWAFVREAGIVIRASKAAARGGAPADRGPLRVVMLTQALGFVTSIA